MQADKIKNVTTNEHGEVTLNINLRERNLRVNGRLVTGIELFACNECVGDLAVTWDASDDSNYDDSNFALLMRSPFSNDDNTATMSAFYRENAFNEQLYAILQEHGFSKEAAEDVYGSEWGMQDVGRASYDAYMLGREMLAAHNVEWTYD